MKTAFIGLGSNLGEGLSNLQRAWRKLGGYPEIKLIRLSSPYKTAPIGIESANWFTNAVGKIITTFSPQQLLKTLLTIEKSLGRDRAIGPDRIIDLDLLLYGNEIIEGRELKVPHPAMHERLFVLMPLAEIDPGLKHPVLNETMEQLESKLIRSGQQITKMTWLKEKIVS